MAFISESLARKSESKSIKKSKREDALDYYKRYSEINPEDIRVFGSMAMLYNDMKRYEKSNEYFQKAIDKAPESVFFRLNYGVSLLEQKKEALSVEMFMATLTALNESVKKGQSIQLYRNVLNAIYTQSTFIKDPLLKKNLETKVMSFKEGLLD